MRSLASRRPRRLSRSRSRTRSRIRWSSRSRSVAAGLTLLVATGLLAPQAQAEPGVADPSSSPEGSTVMIPAGTPSLDLVEQAKSAVASATGSVAAVRAALVLADQRAQDAAVDAAAAAENFNGATYAAEQARLGAQSAQAAADQASSSVQVQRDAYADAITDAYTKTPSFGALSAVTKADGITEVIENTAALRNAEAAMDQRYDDYRASSAIADASRAAAEHSLDEATEATKRARSARDSAEALAQAASAQTSAMAAQRDALIDRLAQLQDITVTLAARRQTGLEQQAQSTATKAAQKEAELEAKKKGETAPVYDDPDGPSYGDIDLSVPVYVSIPSIPLGPAPKPGKGAKFAIAFARAQIGEPYIWAAAGPDAWDCSGLTMGAWANGAKTLPHYSVAQYAASTPISPTNLKPGDLVFWGKSNDPASIYHVALYSGNGMIIQAPRTGVPVQEVSMYAWTAPNFYARP